MHKKLYFFLVGLINSLFKTFFTMQLKKKKQIRSKESRVAYQISEKIKES